LPRPENRDGGPTLLPEAVYAGVISPGSRRFPLALLWAVLATLIIGAGYVVLWDQSAPIAKHDALPSPTHSGPAATASPAPPRQDKNLPWLFQRP
jgi:hypothetical protein